MRQELGPRRGCRASQGVNGVKGEELPPSQSSFSRESQTMDDEAVQQPVY